LLHRLQPRARELIRCPRMIRRLGEDDLPEAFEIVNDAAAAYGGVIPADRWHEPYMPMRASAPVEARRESDPPRPARSAIDRERPALLFREPSRLRLAPPLPLLHTSASRTHRTTRRPFFPIATTRSISVVSMICRPASQIAKLFTTRNRFLPSLVMISTRRISSDVIITTVERFGSHGKIHITHAPAPETNDRMQSEGKPRSTNPKHTPPLSVGTMNPSVLFVPTCV